MSDFENDLREKLAQRAERVQAQGDRADLGDRIERSRRRRDTVHNVWALSAAAAIVVAVVVFATVISRPGPRIASTTESTTTTSSTAPPIGGGNASATLKIAAAFSAVFEPGASDQLRVVDIEHNAGLAAVIADIRRRAPAGSLDTIRVHVDHVRFGLPDAATVVFTITSTDTVHFPGARHLAGGAIYENGTWKMTRATFCSTVAIVGEKCPPDDRG